MDIVITYVDGNDPVWKRDYEKYTNVPVMQKRFRDWGTLKYLLRGIEVNMPFIRNVYLVVSHPSQVPEWVDTANLKIVLHKDIIPESLINTSAKSSIELSKFVAVIMTILYTKEHNDLSIVETDRYYEDLMRRLFKEVF